MSMVDDLSAAIRRAYDMRKHIESIRIAPLSLSYLAEELRSRDLERRTATVKAVDHKPTIYNFFTRKQERLYPRYWVFEDRSRSIKEKIPIIASPFIPEGQVMISFDDKPFTKIAARKSVEERAFEAFTKKELVDDTEVST